MTFSLIRFEVANIFRRILYVPPGPVRCTELFANMTIAQKEKWITDCHQQMEEKYLKDCDMSVPLSWVTATISRLIMSKMWLIVYHPHQRKDGGASLPQETKDKLFITSLENVEYAILLETEFRTMKWGWLFRTYVQWHAIAFLLSELCVRTKGEAVERAWRALEATSGKWWFPLLNEASPSRKKQPGCLWRPLRKLLAKAKAAREREIRLEQASQAVRQGQHLVGDFPWMAPGGGNPITIDQPSSEDLDKLLRPTAPKLGDTPPVQPPSARWPTSSVPLNKTNPFSLSRESTSSTDFAPQDPNPGQQFNHVSSFGLDNVLLDVMDGTEYSQLAALSAAQSAAQSAPNAMQPTTQPGFATGAQPVMPNGATLLTGAYVPDMDFYQSLNFDDMPSGNISGSSNDSPVMDGGNMDWQVFDDMVSQYGFEGQAAAGNVQGGAGSMGLMHFL